MVYKKQQISSVSGLNPAESVPIDIYQFFYGVGKFDCKSFHSSPPPMHPPSVAIVAATASNKNSILRTSSNELLGYGRDKLDYVPQKGSQQMSGKGF